MNTVGVLSGTWMGRRVKTPEEVMEEINHSKSQTEEQIPIEEIVDASDTELIISKITEKTNGSFLFFDVPYQGRILPCVERPMFHLDCGEIKTQSKHLEWLAREPHGGYRHTLADMELEYQMLRISFDLRTDSQYRDTARKYLSRILPLYEGRVCTADRIIYESSTYAVITNKGRVKSQSKRARIPEFDNEKSLPLSNVRNPDQLEQINLLNESTQDFLKQFLGRGWERAGIVLSYAGARNMSLLPGTGLYTYTPLPNRDPEEFNGTIILEPNWIVIGAMLPKSYPGKAIPVILKPAEAEQ